MTYHFFFLIVLSILALGYAYVGRRLIAASHLRRPWNTVSWLALVLMFLLPAVVVFFQINRVRNEWTDVLVWAGYLTLGLFSFLITLVLLRDMIWIVVTGAKELPAALSRLLRHDRIPRTPVDPRRRDALIQTMNLAVILASSGFTAYGFSQARRRPAIVEVDVPIHRLPSDLDGFRIVQLTDIHAGLTVTREFVETVVGMANELKGDIVAFTGDLVDGTVSDLRQHVAPMAGLMAPYGRYFITGNHEYYSGVGPWLEEAKRLGFDVLLNEHRILRRGSGTILLAGVTDPTAERFTPEQASDPHKAMKGAPVADVNILLAHQPHSLSEAVKAGFGLQISGHTHGGQFFPWNLVATMGQPFIKGLHKFKNTWIYVSQGTGYWGPPVRLGTRSEITVLRLTNAG